MLNASPFLRAEAVEARRDECLQRLRDLERLDLSRQPVSVAFSDEHAAVEEHSHRLDGVEGHSLGSSQDLLAQLFVETGQRAGQQYLHGFSRERLEEDRGEVALSRAPGRAPVLEVGTREREHEERDVARPLDEVLDEVEQCAVGPVDVLEHEHRRACLGEPLEEHACRGEEVLLVAHGAFFETEEVREPRLCKTPFLWIRNVLLDRGSQFLAGIRRLFVLDDPCATANHVGQRPKRDAVAVCKAASGVPPDVAGQPVDIFLELPCETRLSDAADPDNRDEMRPAVFRGGVVELLDQPQLAVASDERRLETAGLRRSADQADDPHCLPELDRLGLALERVAARALEDDRGFRRALRRLADEDGAGLGRRLDP